MFRLFLFLSMLVATQAFAQTPTASPGDKSTLQERYLFMKSKAETYQDYKVIKEFVLDGVWKMMTDSLKSERLSIIQGKQTVSKLEGELQLAQLTLAKEREASASILYDSIHISLLGIPFKKSVFISFIAIFFSVLILIGGGLIAKMKLMRATMNEKIVIADLVTREFEEFRHKALDKQTKLARELQTERNKLSESKLR